MANDILHYPRLRMILDQMAKFANSTTVLSRVVKGGRRHSPHAKGSVAILNNVKSPFRSGSNHY
ncbi:hypothetical protein E5D57_003185 [Metarhizium anisopliae]|nr:hypothetical protein E5D57_003185 [Metarhizium anisopliae]